FVSYPPDSCRRHVALEKLGHDRSAATAPEISLRVSTAESSAPTVVGRAGLTQTARHFLTRGARCLLRLIFLRMKLPTFRRRCHPKRLARRHRRMAVYRSTRWPAAWWYC